jgi:hypothetical protein
VGDDNVEFHTPTAVSSTAGQLRAGVFWKGAMKMFAALKYRWIVGAAFAMLVSTNAFAAVSIGVPAGRPYFGSPSPSRGMTYRSYNATPAYSTPTESRQSFSYEPGADEGQAGSSGCCCGSHSTAKAEAKSEAPEVAENSDTTRQSYSYEPATNEGTTQSMRRAERSGRNDRAPWVYQKTDPRRNQ